MLSIMALLVLWIWKQGGREGTEANTTFVWEQGEELAQGKV